MPKKLKPEDLIPSQVLTPKEYDAEKKHRMALEAYLDYVPINLISKTYNIPVPDLATLINSGRADERPWRDIRDEYEKESHREYFATRSSRLNELVNFSIVGIKRALNRSLSKPKISLKDAKIISEILGTLDKIIRLDDEKPTDIVKVQKPASLEEVRAFIKINDPFLQDVENRIDIVPEAVIVEEEQHLLEGPPDDEDKSSD